MELAPLLGVLLCLSLTLIFLWLGLVFLTVYFVQLSRVSLSLLLQQIHRSKFLLVLLLDFDNIWLSVS